MTKEEILTQLQALGSEQTKKVLTKHGAREPFFGVKITDLKPIVKKIKKNHELSLELYATGISDAMYLAGLIADEEKMTEEILQKWAREAYWYLISEYTVAWITAESKFGWKLAMEWITSDKENLASCGWSTLASLVAIKPDNELNIFRLGQLLDRVAKHIHQAQNRVRYTMNGFVIVTGSMVTELTENAMEVAAKIGKVNVNLGDTACKVPLASDYIQKVINIDRVGRKKKMARC
ncbi:MAG: DNA alkylation repair protein [Bacteroidales bacterium]|nr:DNA alkylation repair protein [Bacteroidales bacterium]